MAANDYYKGWSAGEQTGNQIRVDDHPPRLPPLPIHQQYTSLRQDRPHDSPMSPVFDSTPLYEPHRTASEESTSDYFRAGRADRSRDSRQYSDEIPLRAQPQPVDEHGGSPKQQTLPDDQLPSHIAGEPRRRRRREPEKKGFFSRQTTWVVYALTLIQLAVFIAELVKNAILTSSPIQIHPQINPMLGPSYYVLINMGARYVPCMKDITRTGIPADIKWPCPSSTTADSNSPQMQCQLADLCGFPPLATPPNQWFRFIIPIFLHGGIVHIGFNLLLQLTLGREMEKTIGSLRFLLVYMSSGIFGFVLGGNYAANGIVSMGASGSLFGIIAINLLDLLYTWKERVSPWKELLFIALDIIISFVLGLLPGLDNFSHIGGFLMGLVLGICILHSPNILRGTIVHDPPEASTSTKKSRRRAGFKSFTKGPLDFFRDRKPLWWAWWLVRAGALLGVLVCFVVLLNIFYKYDNTCSWCKYLSCLNVNNWCDVGNLPSQIKVVNKTNGPPTSNKRDLFGLLPADLSNFL